MAQQGGLGRGLASLIPQKKKTTSKEKSVSGILRKNLSKNKKRKEKSGDKSVKRSDYLGKNILNLQIEKESKKSKQNQKGGKGDYKNSGFGEVVRKIDITKITPNPYQPRSDFNQEKLQELADSIKEHGIIQPLLVSYSESGGYELIAGERRLEAAKLAGLKKVPTVVKSATERDKAEWALIENIQRHDLNPIEEAIAYKKIQEEFNLIQEEIAQRVGKSRSSVANVIRLLNLPDEVQEALQAGEISEGHARVVLSVQDPEKQRELFKTILKNKLNVRQLEGIVRKGVTRRRVSGGNNVDPDIADLENKIAENLKTKVKIRGIKNNGQIIINYYSEEELGEIGRKLKG